MLIQNQMQTFILKSCMVFLFMGLALGLTAQSTGDAINKKVGLYVFPANGQTQEQQDKDESDCYTWAVKQTGYDPINPTTVQAEQVDTDPDGTAVKQAAGGAAAGAAIGAICGDAGKGAAVGAVVGGLHGMKTKAAKDQQEQQAADQQAAQQNQTMVDNFKKAYTACLEGKGYTVN